ncbi:MAG: hypothetical protein GEV10_25965 [Streptosporangiales bacterium]|nr:hypothetical protein [Streptosporangiales bacterium]
MKTWRSALGTVLTAVLCAAVLTGCGLFGDDNVASEKPPQITVGANGKVENSIRSVTSEQGGYRITVDVIELKRYDKVLRLVFAVTPQSKGSTDPLASDFLSVDALGDDVAGVYLIDSANLRMYPVLKTNGGGCVCSDGVSDFTLDQPTALFADYPLPPESVESMTVVLSDLGPLPGVKVSS